MGDAVLVLDCGATNVRAIAISDDGSILGVKSVPNSTCADPAFPGGLIWDHERIWNDFCKCSRLLSNELEMGRIGAVTVTTFGVDGTLVNSIGQPLYPVISWQCERTLPIVNEVDRLIPELYNRCGLQSFPFNTVYKLSWLYKYHKELFSEAHAFLFISNLFQHRMTGEFSTDATMLGTSMLTDLSTRSISEETFTILNLEKSLFPDVVEPGTVTGLLLPSAARELGLVEGIPVVSAGHDTQFALFGSGASENEPVLSSGTWEILMVRTKQIVIDNTIKSRRVTVEFDAEKGLYNPGIMWIASGIVEALKRIAFSNLDGDAAYEAMITEGIAAGPGCSGVGFTGDPVTNTGSFSGVGLDTTRGQMSRAVFEHLAFKTRDALQLLQDACGFQAQSLLCVGGGSKNHLWNQIRADVINRPLKIVDRKEATALGAACFAMPATGVHTTPQNALSAAAITSVELEPGENARYYSGKN
jgi:L-fuculokinase